MKEINLEKTKFSWLQSLGSKGVAVFIAIFLGFISLLLLLPFFFDNSALKFEIEQKASQISGTNFSINGDVKIVFLPTPAVIIKDVLLQNYKSKTDFLKSGQTTSASDESENLLPQKTYDFYAKSVEIHFSILKFFSKNSIKKFVINDAILESFYVINNSNLRKTKLTEIAQKFNQNFNSKKERNLDLGISAKLFSLSQINSPKAGEKLIPALVIRNSEVVFYDKFARKRTVKLIDVKSKFTQQKIAVSGNFNSENIVSNFKFLAKFNSQSGQDDSFLEVISPVLKLRIRGDFISENRGIFNSDFNGKIEAEISELKSFYKSYISAESVISNKLKYSAKPINISASLVNDARKISIENLVLSSNLLNGKGEIYFNFFDKIPLIDIEFDLENLDIDSLWSPEPVVIAEVQTEQKLTQNSNFNFTNEIKNFDLNAEIKIKNARYLADQISDVDLYMTVSKQGEILILPLIFKVPGDGLFRVVGAFDNSASVPKFVGKFDAQGQALQNVLKWLKIESQNLKFENLKNYRVFSDVLFLPNNLSLNNFYLNLNEGQSEFLGEIKVNNGDKISNIITRFQVSNFNVEDYFLLSQKNIYLSPGSMLTKLLWLNDISSNNSLDLAFEKLIYQGEEFFDQTLKVRFGRGYFEIADLNLKSAESDLKASLIFDISGKNQRFELNASATNLKYKTSAEKLSQQNQQAAPSVFNKIKKENFADQFFALPSLAGFDGKITLDFAKLTLDDLEINNAKFSGKLTDGNLENSELTCDLYGGNLLYKGLVGLKIDKIINGNLSFNNVLLQSLLPDLIGIKNISGLANIAASITSSANKKEDFLKALTSEIKFNANAPSLAGYGLNDLVKKMFDVQNHREELRTPEKILFNEQATTIFKQANGVIQTNKGEEGRMRINVTAPAVNGILSGKIDVANNSIDVLFNAIFLSGDRQKQTPINIASGLKGDLSAILQSTNLDQVRQYLGLEKLNETKTAEVVKDVSVENSKTIILPAVDSAGIVTENSNQVPTQ